MKDENAVKAYDLLEQLVNSTITYATEVGVDVTALLTVVLAFLVDWGLLLLLFV